MGCPRCNGGFLAVRRFCRRTALECDTCGQPFTLKERAGLLEEEPFAVLADHVESGRLSGNSNLLTALCEAAEQRADESDSDRPRARLRAMARSPLSHYTGALGRSGIPDSG